MNSVDFVQDMMMEVRKPEGRKAGKQEDQKAGQLEVYTTERSKSYHKADCIFLKRSTGIITMTEDEAKAGGKEPCGRCHG